MATANFNINAEDGWVAVTSAGVNFIAINTNSGHPFYVTDSATPPAGSKRGYKVCHGEFKCDTPIANLVYVKMIENVPQDTIVDVFYLP